MALNYKYAQMTAFFQVLLGFLCIVFGIADRAKAASTDGYSFPAYGGVPIWTGVWFFVTGSIGFGASSRSSQSPRTGWIGTYLGFSITSSVFAGVIIICYAISLNQLTDGHQCRDRFRYSYSGVYYPYTPTKIIILSKRQCEILVGLGSMLVIFAVAEFGFSIWAAICCCSGFENCCYPTATPQGQMVYLSPMGDPAGYVVTQGPGGAPIAVPAHQMAGGPMTVPVGTPMQMGGSVIVAVPGGQMQAQQAAGSPGQTVYMAPAGANVQMAQQSSQPIAAHGPPVDLGERVKLPQQY